MIFVFIFLSLFKMALSVNKIAKINLLGNKEVPLYIVRENITFKEGDEFSLQEVLTSNSNLSNLTFIDRSSITPEINNGNIEINITISEKENSYDILRDLGHFTLSDEEAGLLPPVISEINIEGLYFTDVEEILKSLRIRKGALYSKENLELDKLFLTRKGIFSSVSYDLFFTKDNNNVEITIFLNENPLITGDIKIEGNTLIKTEDIKKVVFLERDTILNVSNLRKTISNINKLYSERGYVGVSVRQEISSESLTLKIVEPKVVKITFQRHRYHDEDNGDLSLYTRESVLRRFIVIKEGDILTSNRLKASIDLLNRTSLFSNISPTPVPVEGGVELIFNLEENRGLTLNGGINGDLGGSLLLNFAFSLPNLLGRALQLGASLDFNLLERTGWTGNIFFKDPWIIGTNGISYDVEIFRHKANSAIDAGYYNSSYLTGLAFSMGFPIIRSLTFRVSNSVRIVDEYDLNTAVIDTFGSNLLSGSLVFSKKNNYRRPTRGIDAHIKLSWDKRFKNPFVSYQNFGVKPDIISLDLESIFYFTGFFEINYFATRFRFAKSWLLSPEQKAREISRYALGSLETVRGFSHEASVGNFYFLANLENRTNIFESSQLLLELALFFDIGIAGREPRELLDFENYLTSIGVTLRLRDFIVPMSLTLSLPLSKEKRNLVPAFQLGLTF